MTGQYLRVGGLVVAAAMPASCASLEDVVSAPGVELAEVHVETLDLKQQTFLLEFDVVNPNPFPLPVSTIVYGVRLDGHRFASGETSSGFVVPAGSEGEFMISVDLNLLQTAPELLFIVRDAVHRDIPYVLEGRLGVDIPAVKPVRFETEGMIRLQAATH